MPRVNRDLQRRLEARRERTRPPAGDERRYRFASSGATDLVLPGEVSEAGPGALLGPTGQPLTRPQTLTPTRPARRASTEVHEVDYSYVPGDLRRIAIVLGGLLVLLVILSLVIRT